MNLYVLFQVYSLFKQMRKTGCNENEIDELLLSRGFVARFAKPLFRMIAKSWHMYLVGFLFGLGFDTATDGVFMTAAYNWAFATPLRKLYYNLSVTSLGVLAAFTIGVIELTQVLIPELGLQSGFWNVVQGLDFGNLGYVLVILFILVWLVSFGFWKVFKIEDRWG